MKKTIITVIITVLVTIFIYHAYTVYKLKSELITVENVVSGDHATLQQIVTLINNNNNKK